MRILEKGGALNKLSFVKDPNWSVDDFTLTFTKTVADDVSLTLSSLADENGLASCIPYIVLPVDLSSNTELEGEFEVVLSNEGTDYESALVVITDGLPNSGDGADGVYGSKIVL